MSHFSRQNLSMFLSKFSYHRRDYVSDTVHVIQTTLFLYKSEALTSSLTVLLWFPNGKIANMFFCSTPFSVFFQAFPVLCELTFISFFRCGPSSVQALPEATTTTEKAITTKTALSSSEDFSSLSFGPECYMCRQFYCKVETNQKSNQIYLSTFLQFLQVLWGVFQFQNKNQLSQCNSSSLLLQW